MKKLFLVFILSFAIQATAGESVFGITTRGIGMLSNTNSAPGMARSYEIASMDTLQINYKNYALWTKLALTSYSAKITYGGAFGTDAQSNSYYNDTGNFGGGYLTVPILKHQVAFGLGLSPFTDMEQRYRQESTDGQAQEILIKGGLSKAHLNLSYSVLHNLGIGLGYEYIFGKITKNFRMEDASVDFDPILLYYEYRYYGSGLVASAFYRPTNTLQLGLFYRPQTTIDFKIQATTSSEAVDAEQIHTISIPAQIGAGLEYKLAKRWNTGLDIEFQDWGSGYALDEVVLKDGFAQHFKIGVGFEKEQSSKLFTKITEQMDFRVGGFYRRLSQLSKQNPVDEIGLSFGFSFPLQRFRSKIDFAGMGGVRGSLDVNRYQETFFKFGVSISAAERWFVQTEE